MTNTSHDDFAGELARLVRKHQLVCIKATFTSGGVSLRAMPNSFHPMVAKRREEAFARHDGSVSLAEATKITEASLAVVASAFAPTLAEALASLKTALAKALLP